MIKTIAIVGRDIDAWLAALFLQNGLFRGERDISVHLIELPSKITRQDVYAALPSQRSVHHLLGLSEGEILSRCKGTISLGQRFSHWTKRNGEYMHVYDTSGIPLNDVDFFQYWIKAQHKGLNVPLEEFSFGAVSAKRGKYALLSENTESFSSASHGYNFPSLDYLKIIAASAIRAGVKHTPAEIESIESDGQRIQSITLTSGVNVEVDLFIDATGPSADLLSLIDGADFESWGQYFPCDINIVADGPELSPTPSFTQNTAFGGGWLSISPLLGRSAVSINCHSGHVDIQKIPEIVKSTSGLDISHATLRKVEQGIRRKGWLGNCVGIGSTVVTLDSVESPQLHTLHTSLSYLLSLFPVKANMALEADMYNQKMQNHIENIRNFQLVHYYLNERDEKFWTNCKAIDLPDSLKLKLEVFEARGVVPMYENETFQEESWRYLLSGCGVMPKAYDPLVDKVPEQEQIQNFQRMLKYLAQEAEQLPDLQTYMDMISPSTSNSFTDSIF